MLVEASERTDFVATLPEENAAQQMKKNGTNVSLKSSYLLGRSVQKLGLLVLKTAVQVLTQTKLFV